MPVEASQNARKAQLLKVRKQGYAEFSVTDSNKRGIGKSVPLGLFQRQKKARTFTSPGSQNNVKSLK
jgi:hypothetical protein